MGRPREEALLLHSLCYEVLAFTLGYHESLGLFQISMVVRNVVTVDAKLGLVPTGSYHVLH